MGTRVLPRPGEHHAFDALRSLAAGVGTAATPGLVDWPGLAPRFMRSAYDWVQSCVLDFWIVGRKHVVLLPNQAQGGHEI